MDKLIQDIIRLYAEYSDNCTHIPSTLGGCWNTIRYLCTNSIKFIPESYNLLWILGMLVKKLDTGNSIYLIGHHWAIPKVLGYILDLGWKPDIKKVKQYYLCEKH